VPDRTVFDAWEKLESRGKGGQGEVFRARRTHPGTPAAIQPPTGTLERVLATIREAAGYGFSPERHSAGEEFISLIRGIAANVVAQDHAQIGALKLLHAIEDKSAAEKAKARMARELEAMERVRHPSLVQILQANLEEKWFVMEYFSRGALTGHLSRFRGDVLGALRAFRPLVEAVSELHKNGHIHRDIKPDNVFVGDDDRLVLGDFGLVVDPSATEERLTDTYENVGSRDWMPSWAMGMRMDEVRPTFDVFTLGKLFWSLVSGKRFLRLWYFNDLKHPEFDLEQMFPKNADMRWATRILKACVVEHETDCVLRDAGALLAAVDESIGALQRGGQILRKKSAHIRCLICGIGECRVKIPFANEDMVLHCDNCGYEHKFRGVKEKLGWD
jgi:serine/threonine protein kinase